MMVSIVELIDKDVAFDKINKAYGEGNLINLKQIINNIPTIDATPVVHGHWIPYDKIVDDFSYAFGYGQCSACKKVRWLVLANGRQMNYCPSCGAKMDEKDSEQYE